MSTVLITRLSEFLAKSHCGKAFKQIADRIAELPENPEPWTTRVREQLAPKRSDPLLAIPIVDELNDKLVGKGLAVLRLKST